MSKVVFSSDTNFLNAIEFLDYKHPSNMMEIDPAERSVTFEGEVSHQAKDVVRDWNGEWEDE